MKKVFTSGVFKQTIASVIFASLLFMQAAYAAEKNKGKIAPYQLTYVGKLAEQPVFQLKIENPNTEELYMTLEDEVGNVLYRDKFNEKNYSRKFQFELTSGNTTKVKMILYSKSNRQIEVFAITNVQKFVEDVVVTKMP